MDRTLQALKRRLERAELEHLRQHALELHQQLDEARAQLEEAKREAYDASHCAQFWQDHAQQLQEELREKGEHTIGLTKNGELLIIPTANGPAVAQ